MNDRKDSAGSRGSNSRETLAAALRSFRDAGLACDIFGGWAEELLGLRAPGPHADIDLIDRGGNLAGFDAIGSDFGPLAAKRFHHKRAFLFRDVLCEIVLVCEADIEPFTPYWGDVPFPWDQPFLHQRMVNLCGEPVTIVSAANLEKHRRLHGETQPHRWRDPASLVP